MKQLPLLIIQPRLCNMLYTSWSITLILFKGVRFRNFLLKDSNLMRSLFEIPLFKRKMKLGLSTLKIILKSIRYKCPSKENMFVIRSIYVWNIKYNLYIVGSNRVTKVNNQKVNLINYVHIRQCLTFNGYPIRDWSCLSRCIKGFLRQPKISIFCWHSEVSKWI